MARISSYCIPDGVSRAQMADVYCKYLGDNPAERHKPSAALFNTSFTKAWTCPKS